LEEQLKAATVANPQKDTASKSGEQEAKEVVEEEEDVDEIDVDVDVAGQKPCSMKNIKKANMKIDQLLAEVRLDST